MSEKLKSWFLLIFLSCVWGSSFFLINLGLFDEQHNTRLPADELGALRVAIAFLALTPLLFKSFKYLNRENIIFLIIAGVCGSGLPPFLFAYAETSLNSSIVGMLNSLVPLFTIIIGTLFFKFRITKVHYIGIGIAVLGTYFIVKEQLESIMFSFEALKPMLAVVLATVCYATSLNVIKYKLEGVKSTAITSLSFLMIAPFAFGYLAFSPFLERVKTQENITEGIGAIVILAVIGTAIAVLLFNKLIKMSSPIFASSVTYFIPIVAIIIGWTIGENITVYQILGMGILILGVLVVNKGR